MRRTSLVLISLLAIFATTSQYAAPTSTDRDNAAFWYQRAIDRVAPTDYWGTGWTPGSSFKLTQRDRAVLRRLRPAFEDVVRGSQQDYCDFGLDHSEGFDLMLPHLSGMRRAAKTMSDAAMVRYVLGDTRTATRYYSAIYRMADHLRDDRTLISTLVGNALFQFADDKVQFLIDRGALSLAEYQIISTALTEYDARDPFGYVSAIRVESTVFMDSVEQRIREDGPESLLPYLYYEEDEEENSASDQVAESLASRSTDEEIRDLKNVSLAYADAFADEDLDAGRQRMNTLTEELDAGEHGVLARLLLPSYTRAHEQMQRGHKAVEARTAILRKVVEGEIDPATLMNAAVVYMQAAEQLNELTDEQCRLLRDCVENTFDGNDKRIGVALNDAKNALAALHRAARLERCDFEYLRMQRFYSVYFDHDYVAAMHELLIVARAAALLSLHQNRGDAAASEIETILRTVTHLSEDVTLSTPLVAFDSLESIAEITTDAFDDRRLTESHRELLASAIKNLNPRDPCGHRRALESARYHQERWLETDWIGGRLPKIQPPDSANTVSGWSPERVLAMSILLGEEVETESIDTPEGPERNTSRETDTRAYDRICVTG